MSGSRLGQNLRGLRFANFRHNTQSNTQNRSGSGRKVPQIQGISQGKCVKKGETAGQEVPLLHSSSKSKMFELPWKSIAFRGCGKILFSVNSDTKWRNPYCTDNQGFYETSSRAGSVKTLAILARLERFRCSREPESSTEQLHQEFTFNLQLADLVSGVFKPEAICGVTAKSFQFY